MRRPYITGDILCGIEVRNTISHALTDVVEVWSLAPNDTSKYDNGIETIVLCHLLCTIYELKTARNGFDMDVFRDGTDKKKCFSSVLTAPSSSAPVTSGFHSATTIPKHMLLASGTLCSS